MNAELKSHLKDCMLAVAEKPTELRIVIDTKLPMLQLNCDEEECMTFLIDKGDCGTPDVEGVKPEPPRVFDNWVVTDNGENFREFPSFRDVLNFFEDYIYYDVVKHISVESF
jgi:hypothetical protein